MKDTKESLSSVLCPQHSALCTLPPESGFTLIELIMIITLIGILAVTVAVKWPTGLKEEAATKEFIHAFRYAQHLAVTREYSTAASAWGLFVSGNRYTVRRNDSSSAPIPEYTSRNLLDDQAITLSGPAAGIIFNGLGEPMTAAGALYTATDGLSHTYTINGSHTVTFCVETGFIQRGGACP